MHQIGQPVAPSILFPVFNPPYAQGSAAKGEKPAPITLFAIFGKIDTNLATTYKPFSLTPYSSNLGAEMEMRDSHNL